MRILFQEMMLHHPGMVVAAAISGFQLRQRVLIELEFAAGLPRARQLQLVKDAEFHDAAPAIGLFFPGSVFPAGSESSLRAFRDAEAALR